MVTERSLLVQLVMLVDQIPMPDWKNRVALFWSVAHRLNEHGMFCRP